MSTNIPYYYTTDSPSIFFIFQSLLKIGRTTAQEIARRKFNSIDQIRNVLRHFPNTASPNSTRNKNKDRAVT